MSLETINDLLQSASRALDEAAGQMSGSELQPSSKYVRIIGEVLTEIFAIQQAIYALRPELTPAYLNEPSPFPPDESRRFGEVLLACEDLIKTGAVSQAAAAWRQYLETNPHAFFRQMAENHLSRLRENR
jgi:hypothetical protein